MSALSSLLDGYRTHSKSEREKGTYFEELIACYLRNEAQYKDLYSDVWSYADWAQLQGLDKRDTGIDLVAKTRGTEEYHAIQCKLYAEDYCLKKGDIDSFFTASGKKPFKHRIIVSTTDHWSEHAEDALQDQQPPVSKITLYNLENSQIDWSLYQSGPFAELKPKKQLRPHQTNALEAVKRGLLKAERGKLIMACGTGKTFTSLKIAEELVGAGGRVLFLVPSLALLSQALSEWTQESAIGLHSFAVCSDSEVGKKRKKDEDTVQIATHELQYPATTNPERLAAEMQKRHDDTHMSVVFSTYQSIDVINAAQRGFDLEDFDLVICDEAHRTTGATFAGQDESHFVKVHNNDFIRASKRLYMTATPRIYGNSAKATAERDSITLCSMDDTELYGEQLHVITFSEAVERGLLVDYKVIVLAVEEDHVNRRLQELWKDENNQLKVDDAARIIGCWKALAKQGLTGDLTDDSAAMKRAVAFCQVIEISKGGKTHKVSSKQIASMFQKVVEAYQKEEQIPQEQLLYCEAEHVDGGMKASEKEAKLEWLKAEPPQKTCRILSNVRCLSEGVDVPALDAVLFLTPRNSQIDVVQSVGRVMRKTEGKTRGYVILPVVIPAGVEPHVALNDNKTYAVVWQVLNALRSHDDRFDAMINKLDLIGSDPTKMEVIAITDKIPSKVMAKRATGNNGRGDSILSAEIGSGRGGLREGPQSDYQLAMHFKFGELERAIYAKLVQKVGNRQHWEQWANDIAEIANTHISRITAILNNPTNERERLLFAEFAEELRDDLNNSISDADIIEMLAQHLITKPVFDALFKGYSFTENNPMSQAMQKVLDVLHEHRLDKEADTLEKFYRSVQQRVEGIDSITGKQKIIVELYDKFFRNAFPKMTERLGIVYTPVEVVDFIIHSVAHVLKTEFGQTFGSKDVHILDPFTGTGTFITRLLQSGLIDKELLPYKYKHEIHANELVLLAYYIAAINIEETYHSIMGGDYVPFEGICLTDTFQMYEKEDMVDAMLVDNSARRKRQKKLDIRVIMGNPPYSAGQDSANDNNQNIVYPILDERIRSTYAERSTAINKNALYDSYIRAIRWASDRIGESGVIGFVSGSGFIEKPAMDGMRKCLNGEFSSIYVLNLRGDIRKNMLSKGRAKEGQNVFGSGSMTGISVTLFIKNPASEQKGQIYIYDIGDDLSSEKKLEKLNAQKDISSISKACDWQVIIPDQHGDWLNQRDDSLRSYPVIGSKEKIKEKCLFSNYSSGLKTQRDAWCYNSSNKAITANMERMISSYNGEVERLTDQEKQIGRQIESSQLDSFVDANPMMLSWTRALKKDLAKKRLFYFDQNCIVKSLYRPFTKQWLYFNRRFNEMIYQMPRIFPDKQAENLVICINGKGSRNGMSALISNTIVDLNALEAGAQCFPLYLYDESEDAARSNAIHDLFAVSSGPRRRDAITDEGLAYFHEAYPSEKITKEDIFYYIYGLLHSHEYRERFADNLMKELPRIPAVKSAADFRAFERAGRALADLHLNYETVQPYRAEVDDNSKGKPENYRVEKMRYGKTGKDKDLSTVIYNEYITVRGIPLEAYDYVVNGKSAIDWVMERQGVRIDKDSGIVNDANDWAIETMGNPRYPLDVLLRVVTVSLETMKIVNNLPKLDIAKTEPVAPATVNKSREEALPV
ncbi:type ISP restriction/modification enzyme [Microvirga sp. W0021]|uniref:Type ISP restriction/modification enzyme n=1 Tax=Hohaiivirga grylli TaxID=3133970 RepID=A0ABV0BKK7_9HYPH